MGQDLTAGTEIATLYNTVRRLRFLSGSLAAHCAFVGAVVVAGWAYRAATRISSREGEEPLIEVSLNFRRPLVPVKPPAPMNKTPPIRLPDRPMPMPKPEEQLPEPKLVKPEEVEPPHTERTLPLTAKRLPVRPKPSAVKDEGPSKIEVLEAPRPGYPWLARIRGWEGRVEVSYQIQPSGEVTKVEILQSSGYYALDNACLKAVRRWRYLPTGRPEPVPMRQLFEFRLR